MINLILLFVGIFMDITPAVLIFTPIFLPIIKSIGIDPIQFGIMMVLNLCIGLCTPPVGSVLFVGIGVVKTSIEKVIKPLLPLFIAMILSLMLITFFHKLHFGYRGNLDSNKIILPSNFLFKNCFRLILL